MPKALKRWVSGLDGRQGVLIAAFLSMIFGLGVSQAVLELAQGERPVFFDVFMRAPTAESLRTFENDLDSASWFEKAVRPTMQYALFRSLRDPGEKGLCGRDGWWFYRTDVQYLVQPCGAGDDVIAAVLSFRQQLAELGVELLVMPTPGKPSVYPERLTARAEGKASAVHAHTSRVVERLRAEGVEVLDLRDVFLPAKGSGKDLYLAQDTHWSPEGVRVAAQAVAARLRELGWAADGTTEYKDKPAPLERHGDVIRMLRSPALEQTFPSEPINCVQVVRADTGALYADDPAASVLVLGDSFLRIYALDEPGSAGFVAHLAKELRQPVASIVNDGGASTLVRQELSRRPELLKGKRVVIWEFVERDIRFGTEGWQDVRLTRAAPAAEGKTSGGQS